MVIASDDRGWKMLNRFVSNYKMIIAWSFFKPTKVFCDLGTNAILLVNVIVNVKYNLKYLHCNNGLKQIEWVVGPSQSDQIGLFLKGLGTLFLQKLYKHFGLMVKCHYFSKNSFRNFAKNWANFYSFTVGQNNYITFVLKKAEPMFLILELAEVTVRQPRILPGLEQEVVRSSIQ